MADSPLPPTASPPAQHRLIDGSSLFLAGFALTSGIACYVLKGPEVFWHTFDEYGRLILAIAPVIIGAILLGAFLQILVPPAVIRRSLGQGSGFRGFLVAIGIGTLIPGGPMISMPILMAVLDAGAGLAACVAFYLSWSLLAFTRVIQWELPLMGGEFALVRYLASLPLPIVGALTAAWVLSPAPLAAGIGALMLLAVAIIWPIVIVCGVLLALGPAGRARQAFVLVRNAAFMALRFPIALLAAGFAGPLLPAELIATWLGHASGWTGILIASAIGGFVPSGPVVSFPLALALAKAGVGTPQLIAFLTAWSLLSVNTLLAWELPVLGARFAILRYGSSLILPPLSGFLATLMVGM